MTRAAGDGASLFEPVAPLKALFRQVVRRAEGPGRLGGGECGLAGSSGSWLMLWR